MRAIFLGLLVGLTALAGCAPLPKALKEELAQIPVAAVSFEELAYYMQRSAAAYSSESKIRAQFPALTHLETLPGVDVRYFIETDLALRAQTVSIRGTADRENRDQDLEIALVRDPVLAIPLHRGFQEDAATILADALPHLRPDMPVRVTGHSLGGAAAAILANYLDALGFQVTRVVTFGQPRFTSQPPSARVLAVSTRVVHQHDLVPLVPPHLKRLPYLHFGAEVMLRAGPDYAFVPQGEATRLSKGNLLRSLEDASITAHHRQVYLSNIQAKRDSGARQVPYWPPAP